MKPSSKADQTRPWYKEPWPWVIISIPAAAVIMGFVTLYLAITNPDYLVVEDDQYNSLKSELRAQPASGTPSDSGATEGANEDGEH